MIVNHLRVFVNCERHARSHRSIGDNNFRRQLRPVTIGPMIEPSHVWMVPWTPGAMAIRTLRHITRRPSSRDNQ